MTDIPFTLMRRWPGNLWDIKGDDYSTLNWISGPDPKPTETEIDTAFAEETVIHDWTNFRTERNAKLTESDWTQYNDSPLSDEVKAEWAVHRETLRDLPENTDDPADPTWPAPPG
jgi:hypothetical protein